jgi:hypothetical protein
MRLVIWTLTLCFITLNLHAESTHFETHVDKYGYPIDDPLYEDIRTWLDQEERGLALFRLPDYEAAYPLLAEPARHGFKRAQHSLALMHLNGHSVEKNVLIGIALLGLAAESGDRKLQREYDKSLSSLPKKYQKPVRDQTDYYIARYGMDVQGISCARVKLVGSNLKRMRCSKEPGQYQTWDWAP